MNREVNEMLWNSRSSQLREFSPVGLNGVEPLLYV